MSTAKRSAWAETITPRMFGVPAEYFQGSSLYSTWSARHPAFRDHVPAVQERQRRTSRCSLPYSTPTPNGAISLWNENDR